MDRVLLVSMPFAALERQALGISLLKESLQQQGYECAIRYHTFGFADHVGFETYQWLSSDLPYTAFAGDWLFTAALYGERPDIDQLYIDEVLRKEWHVAEPSIRRLQQVRTQVLVSSIVVWRVWIGKHIQSLGLHQRLPKTSPHWRSQNVSSSRTQAFRFFLAVLIGKGRWG